jgi:hypothetical protein
MIYMFSRKSITDAHRAVTILAWDDFAAITSTRAVHIEYLCEPGIRLYELTFWVLTAGGKPTHLFLKGSVSRP